MPIPLLIGFGLATNMASKAENEHAKANGLKREGKEGPADVDHSRDEARTGISTEQE